jgi:hypothetical protein
VLSPATFFDDVHLRSVTKLLQNKAQGDQKPNACNNILLNEISIQGQIVIGHLPIAGGGKSAN